MVSRRGKSTLSPSTMLWVLHRPISAHRRAPEHASPRTSLPAAPPGPEVPIAPSTHLACVGQGARTITQAGYTCELPRSRQLAGVAFSALRSPFLLRLGRGHETGRSIHLQRAVAANWPDWPVRWGSPKRRAAAMCQRLSDHLNTGSRWVKKWAIECFRPRSLSTLRVFFPGHYPEACGLSGANPDEIAVGVLCREKCPS